MDNNNYHNYVIKDGKLIGKFEEMYKETTDPWNQSQDADCSRSYNKTASVVHMVNAGIKSVVEIGCGFGHYTNFLKKQLPYLDILGVDISKTAVEKARASYPHLSFETGNALELEKYENFDAILFAEVIWYLLDDLDIMFTKMRKHFSGKFFINNMPFYMPGQQKYGKEFFTNLDEFIAYVPFENIGRSEAWHKDIGSYQTSTIFLVK